ncbi:hypothetical protein KDA_31820 [Dictyobacter alpinus]|uniref:Uncharacterized protein n=1 Tax=Dictyobacter alpinus TaxID=2014873 RepID=A0A402B8L4_9CHLR|nr:hypothetical protein [Dictyobacter alpinus]GCE27698.1 hypothetical protein KDA_31820 [Dictyobacter alpinus]
MSEYQRYEFMTVDQPLTAEQLEEVEDLSSHIEASSSHALIEYNWGDFKYDPIAVLREYFDGFLYWANWGSPQLAFRFPHGILPANLLDEYDCDEFVTFNKAKDYDVLHFSFNDEEPPDEWMDYDLGSMIAIREELINGDLRALYLAWLASQIRMQDYYYDEEDEEEEDEDEEEDVVFPRVPPGLKSLSAAQKELVSLLRLSEEFVAAAAQYSEPMEASPMDDFAAWIKLLPRERCDDYLVRFARNEAGLRRVLIRELRQAGQSGRPEPTTKEEQRVSFATLLTDVKEIQAEQERRRQEQMRQLEEQNRHARQVRLQYLHLNQDDQWRQIDDIASRKIATAYDQAVKWLIELRDMAKEYHELPAFQTRFNSWVQQYRRLPGLTRRLKEHNFTIL